MLQRAPDRVVAAVFCQERRPSAGKPDRHVPP
jgi:hypothetical protein